MFSTPGIIKFFWPKDNVENHFSRIYDIPLIDIHKRLLKLDPELHANFFLVHIADTKTSAPVVERLRNVAKAQVLVLPDQNSPENFEQIRKMYPNALGKMIVNGQDAHPLAKFLRKNCSATYDYDMSGAHKTIPVGVFRKEGERFTYYSGQKLNGLLAELEGQAGVVGA
jgi:hypothetical protein